MTEIENVRKQINEIEQNYNRLLEELQQIADAKGDTASEDPDYVQKYSDASAMNAQFEALQGQLAELEAAAPAPGVGDAIDSVAPPSGFTHELAPAPESVPVKSPPEAAVEIAAEPVEAGAGDAAPVSIEVVAPEIVAPPAPKYVTVERVRVEVEKIQSQAWNFVGIASNVSPAMQDLASKGGYVSESLLEKKFGKTTLLCPFDVDFPIGGLVSAYARRTSQNIGLIYFPQETPSPQASSTLGQLLQQFLASGAPRGHVVAFLKVNKVDSGEDKASIIVGGLTEQDTRTQQGLKRIGDVKNMATKLGLKLVTIVCTSNVLQNQDKLQMLLESF
jgi:hypothetical protein